MSGGRENVSLGAKGTQLLHGGFLLFNCPDRRHARAAIKQSGQPLQLLAISCGVDLNASVVLVAHPSAEPDLSSALLHEPAIAHALHAAGDEPAARLSQDFGAPAPLRVPSAESIASLSAEAVNGLAIRLKP